MDIKWICALSLLGILYVNAGEKLYKTISNNYKLYDKIVNDKSLEIMLK